MEGSAGQSHYQHSQQQQTAGAYYRGEISVGSNNSGQTSGASSQFGRPNSMGNGVSAAQAPQQMYQQQMPAGIGNGLMNFGNSNQIEGNYKFSSPGFIQGLPPGSGIPPMMGVPPLHGTTNYGERPMSRGTGGAQSKIPMPPPPNMASQQPQAAYIQQDQQQNFHFPAGSFPGAPVGMPNIQMAGASGNGQPPTFHFIANKQKFYAQITPDKAPMLYGEKRPFTAANPTGMPVTTQIPQAPGTSSGYAQSSTAIKRGHSHNSKKTQQEQALGLHSQGNGSQSMQPYANPYHQLPGASKTHSGSGFGGSGGANSQPLQQMLINGPSTASKFINSATQLESNSGNSNQLVSIFSTPGSQEKPQASLPLKMKVKPPNRNNIKEKEQLYEDAIKLKIQLNSYREENVKLKTKIKILENDMSKQEKAMEEFIAKFQVSPQPSGNMGQVSTQSPLMHMPGTQQQSNIVNGNAVSGVNHGRGIISENGSGMNIMGGASGAISAQTSTMLSGVRPLLQQNETFLVMSLKKQLKELKAECIRKEEELETMRKSIKNTRQQEIEVEIKTYIDECTRMRNLFQDMLQQGPKHPLYQERLAQLEQHRQNSDYHIASLQQQNSELTRQLQAKDDELGARSGDKAARKEMKHELSKTKKTLRERERELARLRLEVGASGANGYKKASTNDKTNANVASLENNSFTTKEANTQPENKKESGMSSDKQDSNTQQQTQIKSLQKKVRDLTNDGRSKKQRIDELETQIKQHQATINKKSDELRQESKKVKQLEEELVKAKKGTASGVPTSQQQEISEINVTKYQKELELLTVFARKSRITHSDLCKMIKDDGIEAVQKKLSIVGLLDKECFPAGITQNSIFKAVPYFIILSEEFERKVINDALGLLKKCENNLVEATKQNNNSVDTSKINEVLNKLCQNLTQDHIDSIKVNYIEVSKPSQSNKCKAEINLLKLLEDVQAYKDTASSMKSSKNKAQLVNTAIDHDNDYIEEEFEKDDTEHQSKKPTPSQQKRKETKPETHKMDDEDDETLQESPDVGLKKKKAASISKNKEKAKAIENEEEMKTASPKEELKEKEGKLSKEGPGKYMDEEEMLDVAEHCFIRMAESLIERGRTARSIFSKYAIPEQFPDGTVLELLSPIGFLEGVKETMSMTSPNAAGVANGAIEDLTEMEAACLLRVLAKPELENAIILNEFTMIMENFGVPDIYDERTTAAAEEEDEDEYDDYIRDEDYYEDSQNEESKLSKNAEQDKTNQDSKDTNSGDINNKAAPESKKKLRTKPKRRKIIMNFEELEPKGHKILRKLARFLLERYMHPREFYGPVINRQMIKLKCNGESHPVDILNAKDFYNRMKAAGVRRTNKDDPNLTKFLRLDAKFPHLMQMKKVVKALEEIAQVEQKKMQEEMAAVQRELGAVDDLEEEEDASTAVVREEPDLEEEEDEDDEVPRKKADTKAQDNKVIEDAEEGKDDEKKNAKDSKGKKPPANKAAKKTKDVKAGGPNMDLMREAGVGGAGYGYMNDYFAGVGAKGKSEGSLSSKMALLMNGGGSAGYTQLNTIEEEKHETQTSNYFREGGAGGVATGGITESERDYENTTNLRGSRILDDDLLINTSHSKGISPNRGHDNEFEFPRSAKAGGSGAIAKANSSSLQQRSLDRVSLVGAKEVAAQYTGSGGKVKSKAAEILVEGGNEVLIDESGEQRNDAKTKDKKAEVGEVSDYSSPGKDHNIDDDEDIMEEVQATPAKHNVTHKTKENDDNRGDDDDYEEDEPHDEVDNDIEDEEEYASKRQTIDGGEQVGHNQAEDAMEEESDYEF